MAEPSQQAISYLLQNPETADFFDEKFGSGSAKSILSQFQGETKQPKSAVKNYADMGAGDVALEALRNIPSSAGRLVGGIASAVAHPLDTAQSILDVGAGALQAVTPKALADLINAIDYNPEAAKRASNVASEVGGAYKERYGTVPGFKQAIATDPVGVASDLSAILGLGGATMPGKVGSTLTRASQLTNPVTGMVNVGKQVGSLASKAVAPTLGLSTGAGTEAIKEAFKAGKTGGRAAEDFTANMRGTAEMTDVLDAAKQNLQALAQQRQRAYRANMQAVKSDSAILNFDKIDNSVSNAFDKVMYKGQVKNVAAADKIQEVGNIIDDWKNLNPADFHTPEGLDALKQKVGDVLESIPYESKAARGAIGDIYNSIKTEINNQAPTYSKAMKAYTESSDLIREIEKSLSMGKKASADTQLRKLQSIMRDNVSTNYGQRAKLVQELEQAGGVPMRPALAGQALSSIAPRGITRATSIPEALMAGGMFGIPGAVTSLVTSSPRAMGEAAYGAGRAARGLLDIGQRTPNIDYATYLNLLAQTQR